MSTDKIRPQYHFRESDKGLLAWDVKRLIALSESLPVGQIAVADIKELDTNHWFNHQVPTCRNIVTHVELINAADMSYPIILDAEGNVMDGMHRVCRALRDKVNQLPCVRFETTPEPDHIGRSPESLPYD